MTAIVTVRARFEPVIAPAPTTLGDQAFKERIYAPLFTAWLGTAERFFAENNQFAAERLRLNFEKGNPHLEACLKLLLTENDLESPYLQAVRSGSSLNAQEMLESGEARKSLLAWVEDRVQTTASRSDFRTNFTIDHLTGVEDAAGSSASKASLVSA